MLADLAEVAVAGRIERNAKLLREPPKVELS